MKFLLLPILFLLSTLIPDSTKEWSIKLADNFTPKASFSCELESKKSFHFVIAKDKENNDYAILPIRLEEEALKSLKPVKGFDKIPSILSYHNNGEILTLIVSISSKKDRSYKILDINVNSGKTILSETIIGEDFKTVITKKHESLLLFSNGNRFRIQKIQNSSSIEDIKITPSEKTMGFFKHLDDFGISAVNVNEFVDNGSINRVKAYGFDDELIITNDNLPKGYSTVLRLPLNQGDLDNVVHDRFNTNLIKNKGLASYVYGGKFFQFVMNKENGNFQIYDLESKEVKTLELNSVEINKKGKDFISLENYIKQSKRNTYKPTVTINKTKDNKALVRFDYVFLQTYNYHNNWWFHDHMWQQQMMWQQQQMMNNFQNSAPKFGPSIIVDVPSFSIKKESYFEIVLDLKTNEVVKENVETIYPDLDKERLVDKFEKFKTIKDYKSHVFINKMMYNFAYHKKSKAFTLYETPIND